MKPWQRNLELSLADEDAPPVLDLDLIRRFGARARGESVPRSSLARWIREAVDRRRLQPVIKGIYLNAFRPRPGRPANAAHFLRRDAIVSLNTVLGDAGVLNNPTHAITAVVPLDAGVPQPRLGRQSTKIGVFHFFGVPRPVLEAGDAKDRLDADRRHEHVRATPERALVDWLYLAQSPYSKRTAPPVSDLDMDMLDRRRLVRLARAVGVSLAPLGDEFAAETAFEGARRKYRRTLKS